MLCRSNSKSPSDPPWVGVEARRVQPTMLRVGVVCPSLRQVLYSLWKMNCHWRSSSSVALTPVASCPQWVAVRM